MILNLKSDHMSPGTCWQNAQGGGWIVVGLHGDLLTYATGKPEKDAARANEAAVALADLYWEWSIDDRLDAQEEV